MVNKSESGVDRLLQQKFSKPLDSRISHNDLKTISVGETTQSDVHLITGGVFAGRVLKSLRESSQNEIWAFCTHIDALTKLSTLWSPVKDVPKLVVTGNFNERYSVVESFVPGVIGSDGMIKVINSRYDVRSRLLTNYLSFLTKCEKKGVIPQDIKLNEIAWNEKQNTTGMIDFGSAYVLGSNFNTRNRDGVFDFAKTNIWILANKLFPEQLNGIDELGNDIELDSFYKLEKFLSEKNPSIWKA